MLADDILSYLSALSLDDKLPRDIIAMNPYRDPVSFALCERFYRKYYSDQEMRTMIIGINPGRFGGGITGIPFTDPVKLEENCGIVNALPKKRELSADFIYRMIDAGFGPDRFYRHFYISAVCPLGFVKNGKNLNYYDEKELLASVQNFIVTCLKRQLSMNINRRLCFCLGEGKNYQFLLRLNDQYHFFNNIVPLPHPRFIMQYRRRQVETFVERYNNALREAIPD